MEQWLNKQMERKTKIVETVTRKLGCQKALNPKLICHNCNDRKVVESSHDNKRL